MDDKKLTFREKIIIIKRSLKFVEAADKGRTFRAVASLLPDIVKIFSGIYLSSLVIDGVASAKPASELLIRASIVCGVMLFTSIVERIIFMRSNAHNFTYESVSNKKLWEKLLTMDYAKSENPDTKSKYQEARNYLNNCGINNLIYLISSTVVSSINALIGIILIIPIAFSGRTVTEGFMGFIQSPWGFLTMILISVGLVCIVSLVINPIIVRYNHEGLSDANVHEAQRVGSSIANRTQYNYRNGKEIRIYGEQQLMLDIFAASGKVFTDKWDYLTKKMNRADYMANAVQLVMTIIMYGFALLRAAGGMMSPGQIVAFAMYFTEIREGILQASGSMTSLLTQADFYKIVFDFLDIPDDRYKGTIPTEKRDDNQFEFEFKHVYFKYPGSENYVLKDINLKWRIGEKMALVGRNGSGKSTLIKLLCRLYDASEGEITLNGVDIKKYNLQEYMDLFSVVFQDSALFSFSVGENVAADTEYDRALAEECVRRAGFSQRLDEMPDGLDSFLYKDFDEKGVEISGGEAQKLCLARAIYKGSPFIVLDEPTAALDPISEYDIYTKFNSIVGTRTAIYISHRLSSCRFCDDITVLDNGCIVERGNHDALIKDCGVYAQMWSAQAQYYKDTAAALFK
ncbi:MAG: ABC transporter ATP-binding protein/permease [Butyrivibrio sp.]|nr:ABC transporter ATP-binding protein/permease [Butyrivibrio sp.]